MVSLTLMTSYQEYWVGPLYRLQWHWPLYSVMKWYTMRTIELLGSLPPNHWFWSSMQSRRLFACPPLCDWDTSNNCSKLKSRWQGSWPAGVHRQPMHITTTITIPSPSHNSRQSIHKLTVVLEAFQHAIRLFSEGGGQTSFPTDRCNNVSCHGTLMQKLFKLLTLTDLPDYYFRPQSIFCVPLTTMAIGCKALSSTTSGYYHPVAPSNAASKVKTHSFSLTS